ncbi:MAG TPA: hypothetical protein VMP13_06530 [Acidimicrobiia bacterium]|nr:hypothetical protein [Acidimicrobiia bacterium]
MRSKRLSFVAGWAAVALLAIAGFAAFGTSGADPDEVQADAVAAAIGHTAGAYAGLNFALLGDDGTTAAVAITAESADTADSQAESVVVDEEAESSSTPITSPTVGWLSEVEVRALASLYFEPQDVNRAVRIAWCESRFDPDAVDARTGGVGLYNHLPRYWDERAAKAGFGGIDAIDPEASTAAAAWEVYHGGGWDIFNCR